MSRLDESFMFFSQAPLSLSGANALTTIGTSGAYEQMSITVSLASLSGEALISTIRTALTRAQVAVASVSLSHGFWFPLKE